MSVVMIVVMSKDRMGWEEIGVVGKVRVCLGFVGFG